MLTTQQLATLKTAVIADATAGPMKTAGDTYSLLAWCNGNSGTDAWRVAVQPQEADEAAVYATYDSLVAGKRDSWAIFLAFQRNFSKNKVRNWITDVWGAASGGSVAEGILQAGVEKATNAQLALGGTNRSTGTVTALDRTYTAAISQDEVNKLVV